MSGECADSEDFMILRIAVGSLLATFYDLFRRLLVFLLYYSMATEMPNRPTWDIWQLETNMATLHLFLHRNQLHYAEKKQVQNCSILVCIFFSLFFPSFAFIAFSAKFAHMVKFSPPYLCSLTGWAKFCNLYSFCVSLFLRVSLFLPYTGELGTPTAASFEFYYRIRLRIARI